MSARASGRPAAWLRRGGAFDGPAGVYEDKVSDYVTSEVAIDYL